MDDESPPRKETDPNTVVAVLVLIGLVVMGLFYLPQFLFGGMGSHRQAPHNAMMQTSRQLGQIMFAYATDHGDAYPTGKSSTEVFQKLIDENYITDPAMLYFKMPGKTPAASTTPIKLKPENVCWDITAGVTSADPDELPLVFATGYQIEYAPSGRALPLRTSDPAIAGLAAYYKGNNAVFLHDDSLPDHIVLNFIHPTFTSKGKTYQQLTPDGSLSP